MIETILGDVAHGGFVMARVDGKAVFVTGGLPGERVLIEITQRSRRFDRARVVEVLDAHPERVEPPCPVAGLCGGCDWQHASSGLQLELKRRVVAEQLRRLAGIEWDGAVQSVAPVWAWRTRMRYAYDGTLGLRGKRSHAVVPLPEEGCRIAVGPPPASPAEPGDVAVVEARSGRTVLHGNTVVSGAAIVTQRADEQDFEVAADGFWQVHPAAADMLVEGVLRALQPKAGDRAMDLYCGVGLFAGALARRGCTVEGIDSARTAIRLAARNVPTARFTASAVERSLRLLPARADLVVLDPPRKGAGGAVVDAVAGMEPRAVAYVACDPAALARDLDIFARRGFEAVRIEAFDLFPQTAHIECLATLERR